MDQVNTLLRRNVVDTNSSELASSGVKRDTGKSTGVLKIRLSTLNTRTLNFRSAGLLLIEIRTTVTASITVIRVKHRNRSHSVS